MLKNLTYFLFCLAFTACSTAYLTVKSNPEGATVYIVPKVTWQSDTTRYNDPANLADYIIKESATPAHLIELNQKPYAVIVVLNGLRQTKLVDLSKVKGKKDAQTIEFDLK